VDWLLVHVLPDGRASVLTWLAGEDSPAMAPAFDLAWPLDSNATEELRWYLEDYLTAPFGSYEDRGRQVQARLGEWGTSIFEAVFGPSPVRDAYYRLRTRRTRIKLVFRSSSPALLALPWELIRDPDRLVPLALDLDGVSRSLPGTALADAIPVAGRLRVLLVVSRALSSGEDYQLIARPLLQRIQAAGGGIDLVLLRPPTFAAFARTLTEAAAKGEPFQVVHFDGRGIPDARQPPADAYPTMTTEGTLAFENEAGEPDEVPASRVAQVLREAAVPVVVLNAGRSGAVGKELESAVATRFLQAGTASVVAMAYAVYPVAAAEFAAAFYDRLFSGEPVSSAVSEGRRRLYIRNARPSTMGDMPLDDWLVPVHYVRTDVSFPLTRRPRQEELKLEEYLEQVRDTDRHAAADELEPVGSFIGRDAMFRELEIAARQRRVVVLHGLGGSGKTEVAKAFGRWWRDTGGVADPGLVFMHMFGGPSVKDGLEEVIERIGLRVLGQDFARLEPARQFAAVEQVLNERRTLLIWDNFEVVRSMTGAGETAAAVDGCAEIGRFLTRLERDSLSTVVITSRTREEWLGDVRRIAVGALTARETVAYASNLLEPYPAAARQREKRSFGDLLQWLAGHPLSMRLILPHLNDVAPAQLLAGLDGTVPLPEAVNCRGGRTTSLYGSIEYSYVHLTASARRLLLAVSLLEEIADERLLAAFSQIPAVPGQFSGATKDEWRNALDEAARVGLLTPLGSAMYGIHPALRAYLAAQWRESEPVEYDAIREAAVHALAVACGNFGDWLCRQVESGDAGLAYSIIGPQRRTLGSMLGYALDHKLWPTAQAILQPLSSYWDVQGLNDAAAAWTDRVLITLQPDRGQPPADGPAGSLWLLATSAQAARLAGSLRLDNAEEIYRTILARTEELAASGQQKNLAITCHQLGMMAGERGRLDEAEDWYRKSLAIEVDIADKTGMASTFHQIGIIAQYRGQLDEAEEWYRKSLAIREECGGLAGVGASYHQLGMIAQYRGQLDEAEQWYRRSLAIKERLGDLPGRAFSFGQLGLLAEERGEFGQALEWVVRCVAQFLDYLNPRPEPGLKHLARLTARLGVSSLEESWRKVTGGPLPEDVRDYLGAWLAGPAVGGVREGR
jgi:tetratricopeptide (TPR) repeat protein